MARCSFPSSAKLARRWIANSRTWPRRRRRRRTRQGRGGRGGGRSAEADAAAAVTAAAVVTAAAAAVMAAAAEVATAAAAAVTAPTAAAGIPTAAAADTAARIEFAQRCPASSVKMGTGTPLRRRETTRSVPRRIHITRAYTFDRTDRERALDERRAILAREELFSARRIFSRRLRDASHRPCALAMAPGGIVDPFKPRRHALSPQTETLRRPWSRENTYICDDLTRVRGPGNIIRTQSSKVETDRRLPVTVLSGFLGAGRPRC